MSTPLPQAGDYRGPQPVIHPETEPFWRGVGAGELRLQQCSACWIVRFPVAPVCWSCLSGDAEWVAVATTGSVAASVTVHRATGDPRWGPQAPFVTAQVDMDGGVRLPGRVVNQQEPLPRGTRVRAGYLDAGDGIGVLCFLMMEEPA